MDQKVFILIGRSGCGKGTQAKFLSEHLKKVNPHRDVLYIQSGMEFRNFIKGESETQELSRKAYESDALQPEFLSVYMWVNVLVNRYNGSQNIIFDGSPRRKSEAEVLNSAFNFYGLYKPYVIHIDVSEETVTKRLIERHRMDDGKKDIEKRLAWYKEEVIPTINYYKNNDKYNFISISGERTIEETHQDIIAQI